MFMIVKAVLGLAAVLGLLVGSLRYVGRRIEHSRQAQAVAAVADYRPGSSSFFETDTVVLPRRSEPVDPVVAALRRREALVRSGLDRIWRQFVKDIKLSATEAACVLVASGELPIVVSGV